MAANVCQYWSVDSDGNPIEPGQCPNWDSDNIICTFLGDNGERAPFYPFCNVIGTQIRCSEYAGDVAAVQSRCLTPDIERRVSIHRKTGDPWVVFPTIDNEGAITEVGNFDNITGYNEGKCDGAGTDGECTGYAPYHMGFSIVQPDDKDGSLGYDEDGELTGDGGLVFRLPLNYEIFNERATLSRCHWWDSSPEIFTVNSGTGEIEDIEFSCIHPDGGLNNGYTRQFNEHKYNRELKMFRAPCNGAKPECNFYTGVCWKYCIDEKMKQGDKVLAEQILELRWHIRRNRWTEDAFKESFKEPKIYAWQGEYTLKYDDNGNVDNWSIDSLKTYIDDFETFNIKIEKLRLTQGTKDQEGLPNYPHLVRELAYLPLQPLIRNIFEQDEDGNNVFEVASFDHDTVLIFGDLFEGGTTYGINLSDPELGFMPDKLKEYSNIADIEAALTGDEFTSFYTELETIISNLLKYYPEKIIDTEFGAADNMFYIDMPTEWGENIILILNEGSAGWEFDRVEFNKLFCGGVIAQTKFEILGQEGTTINNIPAYESDFMGYLNNNATIDFDFTSFTNRSHGNSADVAYVYNDLVMNVIDSNPLFPSADTTYDMGYELHKINLGPIALDEEDVFFFGNAGYAIVRIPDNKNLSSVFRPWELGSDENNNKDKLTMTVTLKDDTTKDIEMVVYERDTDRLEVNQIIIKPKDENELKKFTAPCDLAITLAEVYYYEKRSFGELSSGSSEVVNDDFLGDDDIGNYRSDVGLGGANNSYTLTKFGRDTLFISVVFKGAISGRIKGLTRTKMMTWARQPYCRDVEIFYTWKAQYQNSTLLPEQVCYGKTGVEIATELQERSYTPRCGDHDLTVRNTTGPMWYPYTECDDVAYYPADPLTNRIVFVSTRKMELFNEKGDGGNFLHGSWDLRMLGPQDSVGYVCDEHASFWACTCDWSYCNLDKQTEDIFNGWGRYRGALSEEDKIKATNFGGSMPKFGNPFRDFLRSYRTVDSVYYYKIEGTTYTRKQKWMPAYEFYTSADVTRGSSDYPHELYTKDISSPFVHPMGLFLANGSIENVDISEQIAIDGDGKPTRYHFEDVFDTHKTTASIIYPYPTNVKIFGSSTFISWYTYKDYPGNSSKSIQWAWQEIWKDIERVGVDEDTAMGKDEGAVDVDSGSTSGPLEISDVGEVVLKVVSRPYQLVAGLVLGKFLFADTAYPDYQYDAEIGEHRLVVEEGEYTLALWAPVRESDGSYDEPKFELQLGTGPKRTFDIDGNWDVDTGHTYYDLYNTCTQDPWVTNVTLFGPGYTNTSESAAESDGRMIEDYDGGGVKTETYYQRGLNVTLPSAKLYYLPREKALINSGDYEMKFSDTPSVEGGGDKPEADEWYPMEHCINVFYNSDAGTIDFKFDFDKSERRAVDRIVLKFKYGSEVITIDQNNEPNAWKLYHIPNIAVAHSDLGLLYTTYYSNSSMTLATKDTDLSDKEVLINWNLPKDEVLETHRYLRLRFRVEPSSREISVNQLNEYYDVSEHVVSFKCIYIYDTKFVDALDDVTTYERKYNISFGGHGDFPPHGYESTGSLLYPSTQSMTEASTLYQYDTKSGTFGIGIPGESSTMNKVRGRVMMEVHEDKEELEGSTLAKWETLQKEIYDNIAIDKTSTSFSMKFTAPPGLDEKLEEVGATFPGGQTCSFINTLALPLTPVTPRGSYSPCGDYFDWDYSDYHWENRCAGSRFSPFTVGSREVFEYVFTYGCSEAGELIARPLWAIEVYAGSIIGGVLISGLEYLRSGQEFVTSSVDAVVTSFSNPSSIDPY